MSSPEEQGFDFLEKKLADIVQRKPYVDWTEDERYDNLDEIWIILEKEFFEQFKTPKNMQQTWNNANGYFYEKVILDYLNTALKGKSIAVYNMGKRNYYKMPEETRRHLKDILDVTVVRKCVNQRFHLKNEIELDLLAVDLGSKNIICSLTCKTRYRERVYQPLYASRHLASVRSVFVTMDRDRGLKTCEDPSDKRALLESFMDVVFVCSSNKKIGFCRMIRPFREIAPTLLEWKKQNGYHSKIA